MLSEKIFLNETKNHSPSLLNCKYDQDACTILKLWKDMAPRSSIRGNSLKLYPQRARTQLRKYSFAMRVVKYWNSLPEKIITSKTLNTFKNRLDKYWEDQDLVYEDFKAAIRLEGRDVDFDMSEEEIEPGSVLPETNETDNVSPVYDSVLPETNETDNKSFRTSCVIPNDT
jgi:hypothetical protein